jgi:hypothetical protein
LTCARSLLSSTASQEQFLSTTAPLTEPFGSCWLTQSSKSFASNRRSRLRQKIPRCHAVCCPPKKPGERFCFAAPAVAFEARMDAPRVLRDRAKGDDHQRPRRPAPAPSIRAGCFFHRCYRYCAASMSAKSGGAQGSRALARLSLLHGNGKVCVPGKVNLVANLDFIEHRRIGDTSAVFPTVRPNEAD